MSHNEGMNSRHGAVAAAGELRGGQDAAIVRTFRRAVRELLPDRGAASHKLAGRLARDFGSTPEVWLSVQAEVIREGE